MLTRIYFSCPQTVKKFSPKIKNLMSDFTHLTGLYLGILGMGPFS